MAFSLSANGQKVLTDIELKAGSLSEMYGIVIGDSLFLKYDDGSSSQTLWISAKGKKRNVGLAELEKKLLCGITTQGDTTNYYFFEEERKSIFIKMLRYHEASGWKSLAMGSVELRGKLLGSYIDKDLFLICAAPKDYTLRITQLHGLTVADEKIFPLSNDILKDKRKISFLQTNHTVRSEQATAPIKILKAKNEIIITIDEPFDEYHPTTGMFKTNVIRLNLVTGEKVIRTFFEQSEGPFSSFAFDNHLYRVVHRKGLKLEVFNLDNGKTVMSKDLTKEIGTPIKTFRRLGQNNLTRLGPPVKNIVGPYFPNFVIVDSASHGEIVLTIGIHGEPHTSVPIIGLGLAQIFISVIAATAMHALYETPGFDNYFYMKGSLEKGFENTDQSNLLKQEIDYYELDQKFKFKGHLDGPERSYAIYQEPRSAILKVIVFEGK